METTQAFVPMHSRMAPNSRATDVGGNAQRITDTNARLSWCRFVAAGEGRDQASAAGGQESIDAPPRGRILANSLVHGRQVTGCCEHDDAHGAARGSSWGRRDFWLSTGLGPDAMPDIDRLLSKRCRFRRGDVLCRVGDGCDALYAIRSGSCKTTLVAQDGQAQIMGFHMAGEVIGSEGIDAGIYESQATALEDMEAYLLPFQQIENLARLNERFRQNLQSLLAQESARARSLLIVLGTMRAEQRLASFLLDLSEQYQARGYSPWEFLLRMKREEIGSYLGLKLETVSRLFSRFQREGLIRVEGRAVRLLDLAALRELVCSDSPLPRQATSHGQSK